MSARWWPGRGARAWLACLLAVCPALAPAASADSCASVATPRLAALDRVHRVEEFSLHYTLAGPDALTQAQDRDGNGVPDRVEDAALQFVAARRAYTERLGLVHPLQQPRYRGVARVIDVDIRVVGPGRTGRAYDEVRSAHRGPDDGAEACALRIDLDPRWAPPNQTPAHELFHLFQYGYTMFKMPWLTEGTARWSEAALGSGTASTAPLPVTATARDALLASSYEAAAFWNRLAATTDRAPQPPTPPWLQSMRYLEGGPVKGQGALAGTALIRDVLVAMGRADQALARARGLPPYDWPEAAQRSCTNDASAWRALLEVLRDVPHRTGELAAFLASEAAGPLSPTTDQPQPKDWSQHANCTFAP